MEITTLGIDLAKSVFQLHGVDEDDRPARLKPSSLDTAYQREPEWSQGRIVTADFVETFWKSRVGS